MIETQELIFLPVGRYSTEYNVCKRLMCDWKERDVRKYDVQNRWREKRERERERESRLSFGILLKICTITHYALG